MKFIEISNRTCVNVDEIAWITSSEDGFSCSVYVGDKEYPCDVPYVSFVMMVQEATKEEVPDRWAG